jgi:hypothetical protein
MVKLNVNAKDIYAKLATVAVFLLHCGAILLHTAMLLPAASNNLSNPINASIARGDRIFVRGEDATNSRVRPAV